MPRSYTTQLTYTVIFTLLFTSAWQYTAATPQQELLPGFKTTPDSSISSFQPILNDTTSTFSLGFLRVNRSQLALTVLHLPSLQPLWQPTSPNPTTQYSFHWSDRTQLIFNGSLVISDEQSGTFWSTHTQGDKIILLNSSNLIIQNVGSIAIILWQSFDFPTNTLVENQNFSSAMALISSNGIYSLRLGSNFMALYAKFDEETDQVYWLHKALEAKANIIEGQPIYARINSDGFLGMYQVVHGDTPVDVQAFNSFHRPVNGFLFVRIEPDGNLRGYNWDGENLVLNYQAITDTCQLPSPCGSYGLCKAGGSGCTCLDNRTEFVSGSCFAGLVGDLCINKVNSTNSNKFWVLRRDGVELPFKELMGYEKTSSFEQCEDLCQNNCSCWGAVYNNASGFCYIVDYPIQTLLSVGDLSKSGYFKVRMEVVEKKTDVGTRVGFGLLGVAMLVLVGGIGYGGYKFWKRRRGVKQILEDDSGFSPGPYKDLRSASFRSIEMCNR